MSTATCVQCAGTRMSLASKIVEPSGLTIFDVRGSNVTWAYGLPGVEYVRLSFMRLPHSLWALRGDTCPVGGDKAPHSEALVVRGGARHYILYSRVQGNTRCALSQTYVRHRGRPACSLETRENHGRFLARRPCGRPCASLAHGLRITTESCGWPVEEPAARPIEESDARVRFHRRRSRERRLRRRAHGSGPRQAS